MSKLTPGDSGEGSYRFLVTHFNLQGLPLLYYIQQSIASRRINANLLAAFGRFADNY